MIYLCQADGKLPNLALGKLGAYYAQRGQAVRLMPTPRGRRDRRGRYRIKPIDHHPVLAPRPTRVLGSSIFTARGSEVTRPAFERIFGEVEWGGTGVRQRSSLAEIDAGVDWDTMPPDLGLWPWFAASLGYLTFGCRLNCGWCTVPVEQGKPRVAVSVRDLWRGEPWPRHLHLLDNDAFAKPLRSYWQDATREINEGGFKVCFSQGINLRLIDDEGAAMLASMRYTGHDFDKARLFTAWDMLRDEGIFRRGIERLARAGIPAKHLRVYMLVGYQPGETWEDIFYRHAELVAMGAEPFPMVYDESRLDLLAFQRWGGAARVPLYKVCTWPEYAADGTEDTRISPEARAASDAAWARVMGGWKPVSRRLAVTP